MGRVTGRAGIPFAVLGRVDLGELEGLGDVGGMAGETEPARVELHGLLLLRVLRVPGERTVARLAGDPGMLALLQDVGLVGVAVGAGLVSGEGGSRGPDVLDGPGPVVTVLAEVLGHEQAPEHEEDEHTGREEAHDPQEVLAILQRSFHDRPDRIGRYRRSG